MCSLREKLYLEKDYTPSSGLENISLGAYYLESVDSTWRRTYRIKSS
jgi:hypothetical protein